MKANKIEKGRFHGPAVVILLVLLVAASVGVKFGYDALKLDDVLKDENGDERENAALGDRGRGAEAIIEQVSYLTDGIEPIDADDAAWHEEFRKAVDKLSEKELAILNALKQDYTDRGAAKLVGGISHMTVHRFKAKLREMLVPAYRAWKMRGMRDEVKG